MVVDSKGLNGTRDTSLPRFGPSKGGKSLRPALACINWSVDYKRRLACPSFRLLVLSRRKVSRSFLISLLTNRRGSPLYIGRGPGLTGVRVGLYNVTASGSTLLVSQGNLLTGGLPLWALSRPQCSNPPPGLGSSVRQLVNRRLRVLPSWAGFRLPTPRVANRLTRPS